MKRFLFILVIVFVFSVAVFTDETSDKVDELYIKAVKAYNTGNILTAIKVSSDIIYMDKNFVLGYLMQAKCNITWRNYSTAHSLINRYKELRQAGIEPRNIQKYNEYDEISSYDDDANEIADECKFDTASY